MVPLHPRPRRAGRGRLPCGPGPVTAAVVTAPGVAPPLLAGGGARAGMTVLAVSCGSTAFSHADEPGFRPFEEHVNPSVMRAIKVRTTCTTVLSALGPDGVPVAEWPLDVLGP
ncbi:hypothetical protein RND61_03125 [Streptomyces sp. TRM76323]|uniref:Uncharacterized protein n=1 Tax=Streptomyces tamarix TaxID=3078565 RepID=A0ABU3QE68_9ACTN|nr:hypothetical protein [Streptomyces tamarix]MDT9681072.1 hypothetical protein [Streptomyces tamarix]